MYNAILSGEFFANALVMQFQNLLGYLSELYCYQFASAGYLTHVHRIFFLRNCITTSRYSRLLRRASMLSIYIISHMLNAILSGEFVAIALVMQFQDLNELLCHQFL